MGMVPEQKPPDRMGDDYDLKLAARRLYLLAGMAAAITLPLRCVRGGRDSPGVHGGLAFVAMALWAFMSHDLLVVYYLEAWVAALVLYRIGQDRRQHSRYEGRPWLAMLLARREDAANALQPFIVLAIGYAAYLKAPCLGAMLLVSGAGVAANEIVTRHIRRRTIIEAGDRQIEMENQSASFKRARR